MGAPIPTLIHGGLYASMSEAGRALGVHPSTIAKALDRGREAGVGLGRRGRDCKPCVWRGHPFGSLKECAAALDRAPSTVQTAFREGRLDALEPGPASVLEGEA